MADAIKFVSKCIHEFEAYFASYYFFFKNIGDNNELLNKESSAKKLKIHLKNLLFIADIYDIKNSTFSSADEVFRFLYNNEEMKIFLTKNFLQIYHNDFKEINEYSRDMYEVTNNYVRKVFKYISQVEHIDFQSFIQEATLYIPSTPESVIEYCVKDFLNASSLEPEIQKHSTEKTDYNGSTDIAVCTKSMKFSLSAEHIIEKMKEEEKSEIFLKQMKRDIEHIYKQLEADVRRIQERMQHLVAIMNHLLNHDEVKPNPKEQKANEDGNYQIKHQINMTDNKINTINSEHK